MREGLEIGKAMKLWNKLRQGLAVFGIWWEAAVVLGFERKWSAWLHFQSGSKEKDWAGLGGGEAAFRLRPRRDIQNWKFKTGAWKGIGLRWVQQSSAQKWPLQPEQWEAPVKQGAGQGQCCGHPSHLRNTRTTKVSEGPVYVQRAGSFSWPQASRNLTLFFKKKKKRFSLRLYLCIPQM